MTLSLLRSPQLTQAGVSHGFSTRLGGVSPAPYDSLDFATLRDPLHLRENHARLARAVGFDVESLHQATQVHGANVIVASGDPASTLALEADALVAEPGTGHAVAVRVADCVPVLVADPASGRAIAIHAGWRGVVSGIVVEGLHRLKDAPDAGPSSRYVAAIGPCIGPCCFEVDLDVGERIAKASDEGAVARRSDAKAFVDLRHAVRAQLRAAALDDDAIDDVPGRGVEGCTRCSRDRFYSYRRDGDASGRLIGVIVAR